MGGPNVSLQSSSYYGASGKALVNEIFFDESHHNNTANSCRGATEDSVSRVMKGDENERLQQPAKNTSPYAKNRWNQFKSANEKKLSS